MLVLLLAAAAGDYIQGRVSNRLILAGLGAGIICRVWEDGWSGVLVFVFHAAIPIIIFFILFLMRVLGAGDIKLFSIISCLSSWREWAICVAAAFAIGAASAAVRMIRRGNLGARLMCFASYVQTLLTERRITAYPYGAKEGDHTIRFSIAILMGYLVSLGVCS